MAPKQRWRRNEWLHRGLIWSLYWTKRMWRCLHTYDSYLTTAWVMQSWWEITGYYEPRKKWHRKDILKIMCKDIICASTWGSTSHFWWWHPGERVVGAMGKGRVATKPRGRRNLGLQYDYFWERNFWWESTGCYDQSDDQVTKWYWKDMWLLSHYCWVMKYWWQRNGCYNQRKKHWHQSKGDEGIRSLCLV